MFLFIIMQGMQATISTDVIKLAHKIHHKPSDKPLSYCYKIGKFQKHHKMAKDKTHFIFPLLIEIKSLYSHFNNRLQPKFTFCHICQWPTELKELLHVNVLVAIKMQLSYIVSYSGCGRPDYLTFQKRQSDFHSNKNTQTVIQHSVIFNVF